nr:hypothetical protein [Clostridioides difficile]
MEITLLWFWKTKIEGRYYVNRKLISIRNKKKKIEEKLKDLNAKYKEICDEEIQVENEEIIVTLRRNNISLEELTEKINDRKREEKLEKENNHNEEI